MRRSDRNLIGTATVCSSVFPGLPLVSAILLLLFLLLASCSRPPELIGIDNPNVPVASVPDVTRHKIFLATTRQATEATGAFYSAARAPDRFDPLVARRLTMARAVGRASGDF